MLKRFLHFVTVATALTHGQLAHAELTDSEVTLKAALISKMPNYISWNSNVTTVQFCLIGDEAKRIYNALIDNQAQGKVAPNIEFVFGSVTSQCNVIYADHDTIDKSTVVDQAFLISNSRLSLNQGFIASVEIKERRPQIIVSKANLKASGLSLDPRFLSIVSLVD